MLCHGTKCHLFLPTNLSIVIQDIHELECDHEETDTKLFLHAKHASCHEYTDVVISTCDTDIAIIGLNIVGNFDCKLFIYYESKFISLSKMRLQLGEQLCDTLIGLHVFTGCDTTSALYSKGKSKCLTLSLKHNILMQSFAEIGMNIPPLQELREQLEHFVSLSYGEKNSEQVNDARYSLFHWNKTNECFLPPNADSLQKHTLRTNYQAAIQKRCLTSFQLLPSATENDWKMENRILSIDWMSLNPAPDAFLQNVNCSCTKSGCVNNRCSCMPSEQKCTDVCKCINCDNKCDDVPTASTLSSDDDSD